MDSLASFLASSTSFYSGRPQALLVTLLVVRFFCFDDTSLLPTSARPHPLERAPGPVRHPSEVVCFPYSRNISGGSRSRGHLQNENGSWTTCVGCVRCRGPGPGMDLVRGRGPFLLALCCGDHLPGPNQAGARVFISISISARTQVRVRFLSRVL